MLVFFPFLNVLNNDMKPSLPQQFQISHDLYIFKDLHFIEIQSDVNAHELLNYYKQNITKAEETEWRNQQMKFIESKTVIDIDG